MGDDFEGVVRKCVDLPRNPALAVAVIVVTGPPDRHHAFPYPSLDTPSWLAAEPSRDIDADLFEQLRTVRRQIADAEGVPAYIVFSDAVLRDMARRVPRTERELLQISGVGPTKVQRYGARFLELLAQA